MKTFITIITLFGLFVSCNENSLVEGYNTQNENTGSNSQNNGDGSVKKTDIYIGGESGYWKNGQKVFWSGTGTSRSIAISGNDVYIVGSDKRKYWKNGQAVPLTGVDPYYDIYLTSITVSGNDVYVAGFADGYRGGKQINEAVYWKNGQINILATHVFTIGVNSRVHANAIAVSGSDVYVAGEETNSNGVYVAKYWKNEQPIVLTNGQYNSEANSIVVAGGDVYVAGSAGNPCYWKNGQAIVLTNGQYKANITGMVVSGKDVYVCGNEYIPEYNGANANLISIAKYWKNGQATALTNGQQSARANSIAVSGNDVYVSGFAGNPCYWKNGQVISLGNIPGSAYGIVIIE